MAVTVTETAADGFPAVAIENDRIRAVILPSLGGRVWELTDRARARQWIWHRHDTKLATALTPKPATPMLSRRGSECPRKPLARAANNLRWH